MQINFLHLFRKILAVCSKWRRKLFFDFFLFTSCGKSYSISISEIVSNNCPTKSNYSVYNAESLFNIFCFINRIKQSISISINIFHLIKVKTIKIILKKFYYIICVIEIQYVQESYNILKIRIIYDEYIYLIKFLELFKSLTITLYY